MESPSWKLSTQPQTAYSHSPFIDRIDFTQTKSRPFDEIEGIESGGRGPFLQSLDLSTIELKSPTYSEMFNSVGSSDKFFKKVQDGQRKAYPPIRIQQDSTGNAYTFGNNFKEPGEFGKAETKSYTPRLLPPTKIKPLKQEKVPTFFIRMPKQLKKEQMGYRRREKEDINQQLKEIYDGKFKIDFQPGR